jgi:hypothetical protein
VSFNSRKMTLAGPPAVAVHDDGDVTRQAVGMELSHQVRFDATGWNPREELIDAHRIRVDPTWV